jgi:carboxymethylenebutenolidase
MGWGIIGGEAVEFRSSGVTVRAHLGRPAAPGRFPAIILIPGILGLEVGNKRAAERFGDEGYVGLGLDWKSGEQDRHDRQILEFVGDAIAFLQRQEYVDPARIVVGGYCRGGALTYRALAEYPALRAGVVYHGTLLREIEPLRIDPFERIAEIQAPLLILHGAADPRSLPELTYEMAQRLEALGKTFELKVYSGGGHAFVLPDASSYLPEAGADAWRETISFLDRYVRG